MNKINTEEIKEIIAGGKEYLSSAGEELSEIQETYMDMAESSERFLPEIRNRIRELNIQTFDQKDLFDVLSETEWEYMKFCIELRDATLSHLRLMRKIIRVRDCYAAQKEEYREVLKLRYIEKLNVNQIANQMGVERRTVWKLTDNALDSIKGLYESDAKDDEIIEKLFLVR